MLLNQAERIRLSILLAGASGASHRALRTRSNGVRDAERADSCSASDSMDAIEAGVRLRAQPQRLPPLSRR